MKVFTVGLDDKERSAKADAEKGDHAKIDVPMTGSAPIIIPQVPPRKRFGCGVLSWVVAAFFVVLLCLTISEITYNRQRDQAFLTLKWAELRQRMLGFEILSQAQQQARGQVQQPVNELPAFPRRHDLNEEQSTTTPTTTTTSTTEAALPTKSTEGSNEGNDNELSSKFDLLRMILSKMRENAEEMGMTGDVQVHMIEVKPLQNDKMPQQSVDDAFGEVANPRRVFGPWRNEEAYNDIRGNIELPWQFDRESVRPVPWNRPVDRVYQWEGPRDPRWQQKNHVLYPIWDAPVEEPQAKFAPHFGKENQAPARLLTELFGNNAPEVIGHMLGQKNAQAQLHLQQQQMQQQQWPQPWPQNPIQQWPQPQPWPQPQSWPQASVWEQRWDQPQQAQSPVVWPPMLFNQMPPPQQSPFQPLPPPPPQMFQASIGQQNQFPFPAQNQVPILPQPFLADINNNNNLNHFNDNSGNQKPWYMNGNEDKWATTWENNNINKVDPSSNPQPAAAPLSWVDNTAAIGVGAQPMVSQMTAEQTGGHTGHDSEGIDGFQKEEKFNVPLDMVSDVASQTVDVNADTAPPAKVPLMNAWQHAQPEVAEPASAPLIKNPSTGLAVGRSFLPVRGSEEAVVGQPVNDAQKDNGEVALADYPKKYGEPFFQVDEPNFRQ